MLSKEDFEKNNILLIEKAIEELCFEEAFNPISCEEGYSLKSKEREYRFQGRFGAWKNLQITPLSLQTYKGTVEVPSRFNDFCSDFQELLGLTDETLAAFIEEAHQTLYCMGLEKKSPYLVNDKFTALDRSFMGHPKIILNKGRLGWGSADLEDYSPERANGFSLIWIHVKEERLISGHSDTFNKRVFYQDIFTLNECQEIESLLGLPLEEWNLIPLHPWQYEKYIKIQYQEDFYNQDFIALGEKGPKFWPQASLRTLNSPELPAWDIKSAISILNTSCVRGIPGKYIETGHEISEVVKKVVNKDPLLKNKVRVLGEVWGQRVAHRHFEEIQGGSYRYKELLGSVVRESVDSKLTPQESALPTGVLVHRREDTQEYFIREIIKQSGMTPKDWVRAYTLCIIIPLYHLQACHGMGLVAHGQNTILIHEKGKPTGLIIKDFHGDFRLTTNSPHQNKEGLRMVDRLIAGHLIHDLFTGHFITLLRYLSRNLAECGLLKESDFYRVIREEIENYLDDHQLLDPKQNLLRPDFEKVLVNRVRFVAGYSETAERLKPLLGQAIVNPLVEYE